MSETHRCHSQKFRQDCFCRHIILPEQKNLSQAAYLPHRWLTFIILPGIFWTNLFFCSIFHSLFRVGTVCQGLSSGFCSLTRLLWCAFQGSAFPSSHSHRSAPCERKKPHFRKALESVWHQLVATLLAQSSSRNKTSPALPFKGDVSQLPLIWLPSIWKTRAPHCHHLHPKPL